MAEKSNQRDRTKGGGQRDSRHEKGHVCHFLSLKMEGELQAKERRQPLEAENNLQVSASKGTSGLQPHGTEFSQQPK